MTRYDKYDPFTGGFRADLAADFPAASVEQLLGVSLNANGNVVTGRGATNEIQTISITGSPTGGSFKLSFNNESTGPINWNASATDVKTALTVLGSLRPDDIAVSGGPLPSSSLSITFGGQYLGKDVPIMVADDGGLTGGTNPDVVIATGTSGGGTPSTDTASGMVGVLALTKAENAGTTVDVMTDGECVEFKLANGQDAKPGTRYYMTASGVITEVKNDAVMLVGWTVRKDHLIVRTKGLV